jgi:ubiquinone/menaquinone biosynthesis C-methylase UbiE
VVESETRATYDLIAPEYAARNAAPDLDAPGDARAMVTRLPQEATVADVGCGPGREMTMLRELGLQVVGFDLSMGQLRVGGTWGVAQADMRRLPLADSVLHGVWCRAALLHIERAQVPAVLAEFARVIKAGGELCLAVAEGDGEGWEVASNYASSSRRWFTYHREEDLAALLADQGFHIHRTRRNRTNRNWLSIHATKQGG